MSINKRLIINSDHIYGRVGPYQIECHNVEYDEDGEPAIGKFLFDFDGPGVEMLFNDIYQMDTIKPGDDITDTRPPKRG